jgi:hypothetical protein
MGYLVCTFTNFSDVVMLPADIETARWTDRGDAEFDCTAVLKHRRTDRINTWDRITLDTRHTALANIR